MRRKRMSAIIRAKRSSKPAAGVQSRRLYGRLRDGEEQRRIDELGKTESLGHFGRQNHVDAGVACAGSFDQALNDGDGLQSRGRQETEFTYSGNNVPAGAEATVRIAAVRRAWATKSSA